MANKRRSYGLCGGAKENLLRIRAEDEKRTALADMARQMTAVEDSHIERRVDESRHLRRRKQGQ